MYDGRNCKHQTREGVEFLDKWIPLINPIEGHLYVKRLRIDVRNELETIQKPVSER